MLHTTYERVRALSAGALLVVSIGFGGCATTGADSGQTRHIPAPVHDHTTRPDTDAEVAVRPRILVEMEPERGSSLNTDGATKLVRREGLRCYRLALNKERALEGTVIFEAIVTSNGRVGGVEQMSTTAPNERFDECVERVLFRLRFDIPRRADAMVHRLYVRLELSREIFDPDNPPIDAPTPEAPRP